MRQVAVADRIIISKADLADPAPLRERLRCLNPAARVAEVTHGAVDPGFILHAGLFDPAAKIPDVAGWLNAAAFDACTARSSMHHMTRTGTTRGSAPSA